MENDIISADEFFEKEYLEKLQYLLGVVRETGLNPDYLVNSFYKNEDNEYRLKKDLEEELKGIDDKESIINNIVTASGLVAEVPEFSAEGLNSLHYQMFEEVYPWAGQPRMMDIVKTEKDENGNTYESSYEPWNRLQDNPIAKTKGTISKEIESLVNDDYPEINGESIETVIKIAEHLKRIWYLHPYPDGNTRTTARFISDFCQEKNIDLNFSRLSNEELVNMHSLLAAANSDNAIHAYHATEELYVVVGKAVGIDEEMMRIAITTSEPQSNCEL
jgi:fido (protein-threonine AMPylation protein)